VRREHVLDLQLGGQRGDVGVVAAQDLGGLGERLALLEPVASYWRRRRTRSRSSAMLASCSSSEQARMIGSTDSSGTPRR
jgi:hypothetical protein